MTYTTFFRLLKTPIDDKGEALAAQIAALNAAGHAEETFTLNPADLSLIPGSPFAYWVGDTIRKLFTTLPSMTASGISIQHGASTKNDFRFLRLWWEVPPGEVGQHSRWAPFAKGGAYSPYHFDVHILVNWANNAQEIHNYLVQRYPYLQGNTDWVLHPESTYFRRGLTWPNSTTLHMSTRALPTGCVFGSMGPSAFVDSDNPADLMALLGVMNSSCYQLLISLQLGLATAGRKHYEVGIIQRTPIPADLTKSQEQLANLAREAHNLQRVCDRSDETTHSFCLPALVSYRDTESTEEPKESFCVLCSSVAKAEEFRQTRLAVIQAEIDNLVFDLYGLSESDRALVRAEMGVGHGGTEDTELSLEDLGDLSGPVAESDDDDEEPTAPEDLPARVQNLLMWCVGVAFGRWDVRMALDPTLLPALQGPFDPLPRCAPGALVGTDGLPPSRPEEIAPEAWLRARKNVLALPGIDDLRLTTDGAADSQSSIVNPQSSIAWDGILVDDPTHPSDIVARVRGVLTLLWGDRAGAIEHEACEILGFKTLRDYFRDPRKGFFSFHIKRYTKSRRKAPIYWLLQSERRSYGVWLYYHQLDKAILYTAGRDYVDAKVKLEEARLEELRQGLEALSGSTRKRREREIEHQQKLVAEVTDFRKRLDAVALLNLPPDQNDGVVISIAPLWELVPWKEAQKTWEKLLAGEYAWSTMAKQMRERGLVK